MKRAEIKGTYTYARVELYVGVSMRAPLNNCLVSQ